MRERIKEGYLGFGRYLPKNILTNAHLENIVDTTDEWIVQRTGIRTRFIMNSNDTVTSMAIAAGKAALDNAGIDPREISCIRIGVNTHMRFPSVASMVQEALGVRDASAADVSAGCAGFIYGVEEIFNKLHFDWLFYGRKSYGLAIGVDSMSTVTDYHDRKTCVLFGDGAGAVVIGPVETGEILATYTRTQGQYADLLKLDEFLSLPLIDAKEMKFQRLNVTNYPFLSMEGPKVFVVAVRTMVSDIKSVLKKYNQANGKKLSEKDIDYVYPHQANLRIVSAVGEALKLPPERVYSDGVRNYGNTSTASIPIGYVDNLGKHHGTLEVDVAFGAGFSSGAILRKVPE